MKTALFALSIIFSVGCSNKSPSRPVSAPQQITTNSLGTLAVPSEPDEPEPFRTLRREAFKRGLRWQVFCDSVGEEESYTGWAAREYSWTKQYAEDGAQAWWPLRGSYPSRELAAKHLLRLIQGPPTAPPLHKYDVKKTKRRCLAEVGTSSFYKAEKACEDCK